MTWASAGCASTAEGIERRRRDRQPTKTASSANQLDKMRHFVEPRKAPSLPFAPRIHKGRDVVVNGGTWYRRWKELYECPTPHDSVHCRRRHAWCWIPLQNSLASSALRKGQGW